MLRRWGARYEELNSKREETTSKPQEPTLYDELTAEFTRDQLNALLQKRQRTTPARVFICQWQKRKLIEAIGDNIYRKTTRQKLNENINTPKNVF